MMDSQIPQDLENQLAGPGGQFPGTAETLATPVGSDRPVRVKIGQQANRHLQLSKEEYRARSARQREIDAQMDPNTNPTQGQLMGNTNDPTSTVPLPRKPGRPKGAKNKPKPAGAQQEKLIGQPYPAPSTTAAPIPTGQFPTTQVQVPSLSVEERMDCLERGMDMIVRHIAERDARVEHEIIDVVPNYDGTSVRDEAPSTQFTPNEEDCRLVGLPQDPDFDDDDDDELADDALDPSRSCDAPPMVGTDVDHATKTVAATVSHAKDEPELDKGLQELQQMILKRNPQKVFRQYWCQLSRAAQYNEWPPERREAFDHQFNAIVAHPKFIHQMSTFLRGSRSGNCIGNEQIARVCGMVAGFLTVYQLAAAGR